MQHGQSRDEDGNTEVNMNRPNMARPQIFPDKFSGEEDFSEWTAHFNSVSMVTGWSDDHKYKWLNVHVTRKARVRSQQHLTQPSYVQAIETLWLGFDLPCKKELFKVNLQCQLK